MMLSRISRSKPFCNDFHLLLIPVILLLISLKYSYFYIILGLYLIFALIKTKYFIHIILLLSIVISIMRLDTFIAKNSYSDSYRGVVVEVKNEKSYILRSGAIKLIIYDKASYMVGDMVEVSGSINEIAKPGYSGDFDYEEYLRSKGISYSFYAKKSRRVGSGFTINVIKANYLKYLKNYISNDSYSYIEGVVFGSNLLDKEIKDSYSALGISHILAISGMHIMLLYGVIGFILLKLFNYYKKGIPLNIITIYVFIIGAPPSSFRALLFLLLGAMNEHDSLKYTKLDILSIAMLIMIFINPYQAYSIGFILSYLVSFILIFSSELDNGSGLKGMLRSYVLIYLITLPFVINMSNKISLISLVLSPILSLVLTYILLPLSYLIAIFPIIDFIGMYIYSFLNIYIVNLASLIPAIKMPYMNPIIMIIYYLLFTYFVIKRAKGEGVIIPSGLIIALLILVKMIAIYNPIISITFLDCGQGDSTIIKERDKVMVVDAFNSFDYLKDMGIDKIDYLVLTHSDSDHLGDYVEIIDYFRVDKILYPIYDKKLSSLLEGYNSTGIRAGYKFSFNNICGEFISPFRDYNNSNMNSLVLDLHIYSSSILLCADITVEVEHELIDKYEDSLECDILKAPHHEA